LVLGFAIPTQAAAVLSFTGSLTGGDLTTSLPLGANDPVTGLVNLPFNALTVSGAPVGNGAYTPLFLQENFNTTTNVLTLAGTINGCSICSGLPGLTGSPTPVLVTITFSTGLTANTTLTSSSLNMPSAASITSIVVNSTLLSDLGLTGTAFSLTALTDTGFADSGAGGNYVTSSDSLVLSAAAVPEPTYGPVIALLLVAGALVSRRRFSKAA
jgi:hypothetical protein